MKSISDSHAANELAIYVANESPDRSATGRQRDYIIEAMKRKVRRGVFDERLAPKAFEHLAVTAAKQYSKEFSDGKDWNTIFTASTRRNAAVIMFKHYRDEIMEPESDEYRFPARLNPKHAARRNPKSQDPDRQELLDYIRSVYGDEPDAFDIEEAIYWFAANYHGGQWSNLYSVLSTSEFSPGRMSDGPESGSMSEMIYESLESEFGGKQSQDMVRVTAFSAFQKPQHFIVSHSEAVDLKNELREQQYKVVITEVSEDEPKNF